MDLADFHLINSNTGLAMANSNLYSEEFPLDESISYLNHAAVAPWPNRSRLAVTRFAEENMRQGSTHYRHWMAVEGRLREQIQTLINAPACDDIALLKNTSEALSVVAYGLPWKKGDTIVTSDEEFPSNRIVWQSLADQGVKLKEVSLHDCDDPEQAIINALDTSTRLVTLSSIQYASGMRLDLQRIGQACRQRAILFCVDAIQSIGAVNLDVQACHADFVMADAHKWMLGPEGIALFYSTPEARDRLKLKQYGWHMVENHLDFNARAWEIAHSARRFECGSPNMLGIHALHASLSLLLEIGTTDIEERVLANVRFLQQALGEIPGIRVISNTTPGRFGGIVTFSTSDRMDNETLFHFLSDHNILCAPRGGGIRFSPHFYTAKRQMERAVQTVATFMDK